MFKHKSVSIVLGMAAMAILLVAFYFIPPVHQRLSWRMDLASTYLRGVINPISDMPSPNPVTVAAATATPAIASTTPTPTQQVTLAQTALPTSTPTLLPASASLPAPKYEKQGMNNCGPASLSTFLRYYHWDGDQTVIANALKSKPEDRNVNVEELVYFVRNNAGWLNIEYRVGGDIQLLKTLLANGIPVMVEESMAIDKSYWPNDDRWAGHYLFLNGYNDGTRTFVSQDTYYGPDVAIGYDQLEKNWQSFNHVYIIIYPPDMEPTVKSILGENWNVDKNRELALRDAQQATLDEPENPFHWFNVGTNLVYFDIYHEAADAYNKARELGLPQRMLRYQFGPFLAYFNALRTEDLLTVAKYAVNITPNSEEARLWLGWGLFRSGDSIGAEKEFKKALFENENYTDAIYALNFLANQ